MRVRPASAVGANMTLAFDIIARADGEATELRIAPSEGSPRDYRIGGGDPEHYALFYAELARDFADAHLKPGGNFLIKLFQGEGFDAYVKDLRTRYERLVIRKPAASRRRSNEVYALALGKRRGNNR